MLNVDQTEYVSWTSTAGFNIFIHDKQELVYPESVSYTVTPGTVASLIVSQVNMCIIYYSKILSYLPATDRWDKVTETNYDVIDQRIVSNYLLHFCYAFLVRPA